MILFTKDKTTENKRAYQKPLTVKPVTNLLAKITKIALITSKNKPKVTTVKGKVKNINSGFTKAFNKASITATPKAVNQLVTCIPGKNFANTTISKEVIIKFKIVAIV